MFDDVPKLLYPDELTDEQAHKLLNSVGFSDWQTARRRLQEICHDEECRFSLAQSLPMLLTALSDAAVPDSSLINFERFVQCVPSRIRLFNYLAENPRAVEILIKLFVGSQFLTEILLRNPGYLDKLTQHKRVAEFKSQQQFFHEAQEAAEEVHSLKEKFDALRRFQRWELLRIGACDSFGLMDLKTITVQLSLLADSLVQSCLSIVAEDLNLSPEGFAVISFGKLGGEELNYSSDIDLVFVADTDATTFWPLGQKLIKALMESTGEGFLYRVDMRLRPWGRSGPLVTSVDAYINYLKKHGMLWEKQALLKARVIAGDQEVGRKLLQVAEPLIFDIPEEAVRENVRGMKQKIEANLGRQGREWGEVKSGAGSIRDVEFVTQFLQMTQGRKHPEIRSINTLDGLIRLADFGLIQADEYRHLTSGYVFLRTIEHSLQLMHYKQIHTLPENPRELAYLARRLDFPDSEYFITHYERHCDAVRAIYDKYIGGEKNETERDLVPPSQQLPDHTTRMEASYSKTFSEEEIQHHAQLLKRLSNENIVEVEAESQDDGLWKVTVVGYDHAGDLSMICGLLFVYGFDIVAGNIFTDQEGRNRKSRQKTPLHRIGRKTPVRKASEPPKFVNVFTIRPPLDTVLPEVWDRYKNDLAELLKMVQAGQQRDAQGRLAKRVAGSLRETPETETALYPIEVELDNSVSDLYTVLHIRAEDTSGFLYELANSLALSGIDIVRVLISSVGNRVFDTLYVTDSDGEKITDPERERELRAAVVLIKHFTHLLPRSPNPQSALLHFRELLQQLFKQPNWPDELSSLENSDVLDALARLLGVSDFLWEDFLRLQHTNLFPVVKDVRGLAHRKPKDQIETELKEDLQKADDWDEKRKRLNDFKDREMFRADMRHILGRIKEFGEFSQELTNVAEVVVDAAQEICDDRLQARYGRPQLSDGSPCPLTICALGKCGGRELGFASDIELMFIYEGNGQTTGPETITTAEYYSKLVELFKRTIKARREGIFQLDLRLRPYGRAGSLAVSYDAFRQYFAPHGAAWPYERQALVKLRPIAGDENFGCRVVHLRDELVYTGEPFDVAAMRAMREKQVGQLVKAGTINAKLSPGGLVDSEYLVQGLQITYGHRSPTLRATNTREAMAALNEAGILSEQDYQTLLDAYIFQRRLIDALRMVRGHARDLTVPPAESEEFEFLSRRLGYNNDLRRLQKDLELHSRNVQELGRILDQDAEA